MKDLMFPASGQQSDLSWWQLCIVFVLAVLLFVVLRWQPEPWLKMQIDSQARQYGIGLQYENMRVNGLTIHLDHLSIQAAGLSMPVKMDMLSLSPAWASLVTGSPGVLVIAAKDKQHAAALLAWQDNRIAVHDLDVDLDVAQLESLWRQRLTLPIHIGGRIMLSGNMLLNGTSATPVEGDVKMLWKSAVTDVTGLDKPLGDYRLGLKGRDAKTGSWQWLLAGGSVLKLSGQGTIDISSALWQQWAINGEIRLEPVKNDNAIAAMLDGKAATFKLSGNVLNPHLQAFAGGH